jgi:hypothetical protein
MNCKHENAEHMMAGDSSTPDWCVQVYAECEQFRCIDCGAWLSLGPDTDEDMYREVELGEFLRDIHLLWEPGATRNEMIEIAIRDCSEIK